MKQNPPEQRLDMLEGLRGLLSLWVFGSHLISITGHSAFWERKSLQLLTDGANAVAVFIILSGFFIARIIAFKK